METHSTGTIPKGWTADEFKVFKYYAMNYPKREIAKETGINVHNVDMHIRNIFDALDVHERGDMIQEAYLTDVCTKETFKGMKRYRKEK